jgi:hypothetical protein
MSIEQLVEQFTAVAVAEYEAIEMVTMQNFGAYFSK